MATTAPIRCWVKVVVVPRIAVGSSRTIDSRRWRSGHRIAVITAPRAVTLKIPLAKFAAACLPKIRLAPEAGDILLSLGLSASPDHTRRCCTTLPMIAAIASINNGTPIAATTAYSSEAVSARSPGPSLRIIQELAIRLRIGTRMPPPIDPENVDSSSVAPAITNQVLSSWLLTTSPRSSASSRRFCVGSSVLSEVSFSSAIDRYPPFATFQALFERRHVVHHADEVVEEGSHHRREHGGENQEAC